MLLAEADCLGVQAIYGRNWGCSPFLNVKHLHFEMCYYQASSRMALLLKCTCIVRTVWLLGGGFIL